MTRLVVTGGMGFIGSCFVRRRLATGKDEVVVVDKLTYAGNPNNLKDYKDDRNLTFVQGDVCDRKLMDRITKSAEALVHFAAETHVDGSILEAGDFVRADVIGTWSVLEACFKNEVQLVRVIRPNEVYGERAHGIGSGVRVEAPPWIFYSRRMGARARRSTPVRRQNDRFSKLQRPSSAPSASGNPACSGCRTARATSSAMLSIGRSSGSEPGGSRRPPSRSACGRPSTGIGRTSGGGAPSGRARSATTTKSSIA